MIQYIAKRILLTIPTILVISLISFIIIQLPPGSWLDTHIARLMETGETISEEEVAAIKAMYGLDKPMPMQYLTWVWGSLHGDFGVSYEWNEPVGNLIWERLALTVTVSFTTMIFIWLVSFPIAIYSATHQYSLLDYLVSFLGFIGLGVPSFLLALVGLWIGFRYFSVDLAGLFSDEYMLAPWSWGKVVDMFKHLWFPLIILSIGGTASLIRHTRANLLDQIRMPYVTTARAKGLTERKVLLKYPVRVALRPFGHRRLPAPGPRVRGRHRRHRARPAHHGADAAPLVDDAGHVPRRDLCDAAEHSHRDRAAALGHPVDLCRPADPLHVVRIAAPQSLEEHHVWPKLQPLYNSKWTWAKKKGTLSPRSGS
jgi:peptide/nickel transport system permease protein